MRLPKVKVCCIKSATEAQLAIQMGANAIGLVGPMPSGPGIISNQEIATIIEFVGEHIDTFLLTSEVTFEGILQHYQETGPSTIQLVDHVDIAHLKGLKEKLSTTTIVQVIHVQNEEAIEEAIAVAPFVDHLLLDSGNPKAPEKVLGGTGNVHDWSISRRIINVVGVPVYLAGGINANNVKEAIQQVKPFGLDLCSGVRTNGELDAHKLKAFFEAVNSTPL